MVWSRCKCNLLAVSLWKFRAMLLCFCLHVEQSDEPDADDLSLHLLSVSDYTTVDTFFGSEKTEVALWVT